MNNKQIAIIGAGASGLLCSIVLARFGFIVKVFEKNTKIGRKLLTTGNGRCNISNQNISLENFYTSDKHFVQYALQQFDHQKFQQFFQQLGLELTYKENGRIYPMSLQSSSVVDLLVYEAQKFGVEFILDTKVEQIKYQENTFILKYNENKQKFFDKVIVATGSKAMPKLGSCDIGYEFAKTFGHQIINPFASLVQLVSKNKDIKNLSGVKIDAKIDLEIDGQSVICVTGDTLFTDYGISGSAILDVSREASYNLNMGRQVVVKIDIFPKLTKDELISILSKRLKNSNDKDKYFWLEGFVHKKLIKYIIDSCKIIKTKHKAKELNKKDIMSLVYFMKNMKIEIADTKGFDTAEVSAGGVDVSQINKKTMQSNLQNKLYFIGEVLDVDGQCGGYNLHWAWASGFVCANSIIKNNTL